MTETITITHRATKDAVSTTVEVPGLAPMTKTWKRKEAGHYEGDSKTWWDEEFDLPPEVRDVADHSVTGLCSVLNVED